jgi:hypothetical protein
VFEEIGERKQKDRKKERKDQRRQNAFPQNGDIEKRYQADQHHCQPGIEGRGLSHTHKLGKKKKAASIFVDGPDKIWQGTAGINPG